MSAIPGLTRQNATVMPGNPASSSLFGGGGFAPNNGPSGGLFGQPAATAGGGTLFGAATAAPTASTGLFGGAPINPAASVSAFGTSAPSVLPFGGTPNPAAAKPSMFGAQPAPAATGLFGNPSGIPPAGVGVSMPGLFGQPTQPATTGQPTSTLFGAPQQPQPQFGAQQPFLGQVVQSQPQGQFISFLEAASRAAPLRELRSSELALPLSNPFNKKTMGALPGQEQTYQTALQIEKTLNQQEKDMSEIEKAMKELSTETTSLRSAIGEASRHSQAQGQRVSQIKLQIEAMEADLRKNFAYHEQLERIVDQFNDPQRAVQVPFPFFYDLYREQEREVTKLNQRVQQAENLAEKLLQETLSKRRDAARGQLVDSDLDQVSLRDKIFQVCSMLYAQQKKAGLNLVALESSVKSLRTNFTQLVLLKHHWETEETINQLFARSQGIEMNGHLSQLQKRKFETTLSKEFDEGIKLFNGKSDKSATFDASKKLQTPAGKLMGGSLTERLHRGTQASIRMGRRQGSQLGITINEGREELGEPATRLGKRTHIYARANDYADDREFVTPSHFTPRQRVGETSAFRDTLPSRRGSKEQFYNASPNLLYRQSTTDKRASNFNFARNDAFYGGNSISGMHSFNTSASSDRINRQGAYGRARNPLF